MSSTAIQQLQAWGRLVKFSHTIFALPFALSMAAICAVRYPISRSQIFFILLALVTARTAAMGFNRLLDREIDALNPRTYARELPAGVLSVRKVRSLILLSSALFVLSAAMLGRHCLYLSPVVISLLFFYSYTKRFTSLSHYFLGLALALAPGGVWYALSAEVAWLPVYMMCGVLLWVAGFDTLYSCQDLDFDRAQSLHSIPASVGIKNALRIAASLHFLSIVFLIVFGLAAKLGGYYFAGLAIFAALLFSQHKLLIGRDLSRINSAFFTRNAWASMIYLAGVLVDLTLA